MNHLLLRVCGGHGTLAPRDIRHLVMTCRSQRHALDVCGASGIEAVTFRVADKFKNRGLAYLHLRPFVYIFHDATPTRWNLKDHNSVQVQNTYARCFQVPQRISWSMITISRSLPTSILLRHHVCSIANSNTVTFGISFRRDYFISSCSCFCCAFPICQCQQSACVRSVFQLSLISSSLVVP